MSPACCAGLENPALKVAHIPASIYHATIKHAII
jgi:hypothetical protein